METIEVIKEEYYKKLEDLKTEKLSKLEKVTRDLCKGYLDNDVISKKSNKKGALRVVTHEDSIDIRFFPYIKSGERLSKKEEDYIFIISEGQIQRALLDNYEIVEE